MDKSSDLILYDRYLQVVTKQYSVYVAYFLTLEFHFAMQTTTFLQQIPLMLPLPA